MRQRDAPERLVAMRPFGRLGAQELAPRRRVEVELLHRRPSFRRQAPRARSAPRCRLRPRSARRAARPARATRARGATPRRSTPAPRRGSPASRSLPGRSSVAILDVAWRATASARSSRPMPAPLSATRIRLMPPPARSTSICVAPASRLFSSSSFSAAAGRSTTSPAAIWLISRSGSGRIAFIVRAAGGAPSARRCRRRSPFSVATRASTSRRMSSRDWRDGVETGGNSSAPLPHHVSTRSRVISTWHWKPMCRSSTT